MNALIVVLLVCGGRVGQVGAMSANGSSAKISNYERLRAEILGRAVVVHKMPPDVMDDAGSYKLSFRLWLLDVYDIDELNQVITLNAYIDVRWTQKQLSWNASSYGGIDFIYVDTVLLWSPTILIVMGQKDSFVLEFAQSVIISSEGEVVSKRHNHLTFTCSIDFDKYPFDVQSCSVGFFPTGIKMVPKIEVFEMEEYSLSEYVNVSGEWIYLGEHHDIVKTAGNLPDFPRYYFKMRRQRTYYVIAFIFPVILTSIMIPLAFLIPSYTGEKISYLVAMFTSTAIYLNYISEVMPRSLSQMPYMAVFLIEVLVECLLAMMASLVVVSRYFKEQMYATQRALDTHLLTSTMSAFIKDIRNKPAFPPTVIQGSTCTAPTWCITSRSLDYVFFFSFVSVQVIFLMVIFGSMDWI